MRVLILLLALTGLPILQGCVALAVGAAAGSGYMVGEDRRPTAVMTDDQGIELKASNRLSEKFPNAHIVTTSYNKLVLLTGEAPDEATKAEADRIVRGVEGVRGTFNELQVGPVSALSARASDSYVTSKVKTRFLDAGKFNALHVKVVTEQSTVYLMGLVKRSEANDATELARTTTGVQRVVRAFEFQD
jgi:osmotically-inducible protein OsmY